MKTILKWLEEAKQQGYDWADAAIRNYDPEFSGLNNVKSLTDAIFFAFHWPNSPEGDAFWKSVTDSLNRPSSADSSPTTLHELALLYDNISESLSNLDPDISLREPYRKASFEVYKANYEAELAELTEKITEKLGMGNLRGVLSELKEANAKLEWAKYEYKEYKEVSDNTIQSLNKDRERQLSYSQSLEKELEAVKSKKLIGWAVQNEDGGYSMRKAPNFSKEAVGWCTLGGISWSDITPEQASALCDRLPKWTDDEPTPIYK